MSFTSFMNRSCSGEVTMNLRLDITTGFSYTMFPFLFLRMELWKRKDSIFSIGSV
jgi:hypothetical protein